MTDADGTPRMPENFVPEVVTITVEACGISRTLSFDPRDGDLQESLDTTYRMAIVTLWLHLYRDTCALMEATGVGKK
jgi:hypothetical protein